MRIDIPIGSINLGFITEGNTYPLYAVITRSSSRKTESTFAPLVVFVINNNIYVIELMFSLGMFQKKFKDELAKGL